MNSNKKIMYMVIGIAILLIGVVGVTYSFFNYTRTGALNNLGTGRIYFNSTQNGTLNMTNIFPLTSTQAGEAQLDTVTVGIVGDTTYSDGEEFEISLVDVENTINGKKIPMNFIASYTANTGGSIGNSSNDYWNARESKDASIYHLNETGKVEEGKQILAGYINDGATGINGTLTIKVYIDADRIAITDTPDENSEWQQGREVFSTSEWNSFQSSGTPLSFKIRAESNEGIWIGRIDTCPNCKFIFPTAPIYVKDNTVNATPTNIANITETISTNYHVITDELKGNYDLFKYTFGDATDLIGSFFIGIVTNSDNLITKLYSCNIHNGTYVNCLEEDIGGSTFNNNKDFLQSEKMWNNSCTVEETKITCGELSTKTYNAGSPRTVLMTSGVITDSIFNNGNHVAMCQNNGNAAACAIRYLVNGG